MAYVKKSSPYRVDDEKEPIRISGTVSKINIAMQDMTDFSSKNEEFVRLIRQFAWLGGEICYLSKNFYKSPDHKLAEQIFIQDKELSRIYMYAYMKYAEDCHVMMREAVYNDAKSEVDKLKINYYTARKYLEEFIKKYIPENADFVNSGDIDKLGYGAQFSDDI